MEATKQISAIERVCVKSWGSGSYAVGEMSKVLAVEVKQLAEQIGPDVGYSSVIGRIAGTHRNSTALPACAGGLHESRLCDELWESRR